MPPVSKSELKLGGPPSPTYVRRGDYEQWRRQLFIIRDTASDTYFTCALPDVFSSDRHRAKWYQRDLAAETMRKLASYHKRRQLELVPVSEEPQQ